jgi:hypothetical protein
MVSAAQDGLRLRVIRRHDVPFIVVPVPSADGEHRPARRLTIEAASRSEGPKRRTSRRHPRRFPHSEPARQSYRKRSWNIRLTWIVWYPIEYQTIRRSPIFHAKPDGPARLTPGRTRHGIHPASPPPAATAPPARPRRTRLRGLTSEPPQQRRTIVVAGPGADGGWRDARSWGCAVSPELSGAVSRASRVQPSCSRGVAECADKQVLLGCWLISGRRGRLACRCCRRHGWRPSWPVV